MSKKRDPIACLNIGDTITVKEEVECYYYNYPSGRNLVKFHPGESAVISEFPPKCRDVSKDGSEYFVLFDTKNQRFGTSWKNIVVLTQKEKRL